MFSSRKQGTKYVHKSLLAPYYVQIFIHLVNFHVAKKYKLQTPTHSKANSQNVTSLYKMYREHLKILHIQPHPQIQHPTSNYFVKLNSTSHIYAKSIGFKQLAQGLVGQFLFKKKDCPSC